MPSPQPPIPSLQPLIVLASQSPRRRELLVEAGYDFVVVPPNDDVECSICSNEGPAGLVADLAYRKAAAVRRQLLDTPHSALPTPHSAIILAADTVAECDGFILGKPRDETHARAMLTQLSGREHRVLTGVCLWPVILAPLPFREGQGEGSADVQDHAAQTTPCESTASTPLIRVAVTRLRMDNLTKSQLDDYLASGAWQGKAGAFGYQDRLGWVHIIEGSPSNVVGLPLELLADMLAEIAVGNGEH